MKFPLLTAMILLAACTSDFKSTASENERIRCTGIQQYTWQDTLRIDPYYGDYRLVNARVWYPCNQLDSTGPAAGYYFRVEDAYPQLPDWSDSDFERVRSVHTTSVIGRPFADNSRKYPLIVFSPSLGGNLSQYTFYAEQLAREGFVVMGINHLFESEYVIDPEGIVHTADLSFHDSLKTLDIPEMISADEYRAAKGRRQSILGEDLLFSMEQLLHEPFFREYLLTDRIGVFGHSIGGAAAIYAALMDKRISAVIDLDGTPPTAALERGIDAPFLFIEDLTDYRNHAGYAQLHNRRNAFCEQNRGGSWRILIGGANHNSFLDIHYYLETDDIKKEIAFEFLDQVADYMSGFFLHHLDSTPMLLSEVKSDSIEIIYFSKGAISE